MGHRKDIGNDDLFDELIEVTQKSDMSMKFSTRPGVLQVKGSQNIHFWYS